MAADRRDDIDYVNDHRQALGRAPIPYDTAPVEVDRMLALVEEHAPFGEDPFTGDDGVDNASPFPLLRAVTA